MAEKDNLLLEKVLVGFAAVVFPLGYLVIGFNEVRTEPTKEPTPIATSAPGQPQGDRHSLEDKVQPGTPGGLAGAMPEAGGSSGDKAKL